MKTKITNIIVLIIVATTLTMGTYYTYQYFSTKDKLNETIDQMATIQNELDDNKEALDSTSTELATTQEILQVEIEKSEGLSRSLGNMSKELEDANIIIEDLKNTEYELVYMGSFKISHYCSELHSHICGTGTGRTATGTTATVGRTIAVDPSVIPYGSQVYIEGYGWRTAEDCGGGVDGKQIDMLVSTHSQAMSMGVKYGGVWILIKRS